MGLIGGFRQLVPPHMRVMLRRSRTINRLLAWKYGGEQCKPHPLAPYQFYFDGYKHLGWAIGSLSEYEAPELRFAGEQIRQKGCSCIWDIGANIGFWSLYFASLQPPVQKVLCFEPDPANQHFLELNRVRNQIASMQLHGIALSSREGEATFFSDPLTGTTGSLEAGSDFIESMYAAQRVPIQVKLSTIDAEIDRGLAPPDFIKIDVEGHELEVLQGAQQTLTDRHPTLVMEVTSHHEEVGFFLRKLGYQLVNPNNGVRLDRPEFATAAVYHATRS